MSDDPLSQATRALREETTADDASARFTRARIMASLHQSRVTRRKRLAVVIPVAASFAMATAYAAASGKLPRMITTIVRALGGAPQNTPPARPPEPHFQAGHGALRATQPAESVAPGVVAPAPTTEPEHSEPAPSPRASARVSPASRPQAATDLPDESDPGFALYRSAHRAHFVDHDPARALGAWDAYLAATPTGRFALEARYNRALCLVRLGRHTDAVAALTPFARGDFGGYRRREAGDLLQALADAGSPSAH